MSSTADAGTFRFNSRHDAMHFAEVSVQNGRNWLAAHNIRITDDYLKGNVELHLDVAATSNSSKFKLISSVIPFVDTDSTRTFDIKAFSMEPGAGSICRNSDNSSMLFPSKSCKGPQKTIASEIRIEPSNERAQVWVNGFAVVPNFKLKVLWVFPEREIDILSASGSEHQGSIAGGLVKRVAQIVYNSVDLNSEGWGNWLIKSELYDFLAGLRIELLDNLVLAHLDKDVASRFDISNVFLSGIDE